jgi:hypothetical protein
MTIEEAVRAAIEDGVSIRVRYFGGSSPGEEREMIPLGMKDGSVRALCLRSGTNKSFRLDKMELVIDGVASTWQAPPEVRPEPLSGDELAARTERLGWIVLREGDSVSLHRAFKSGKIVKTPVVQLAFEPVSHDSIFDGAEYRQSEPRERSRPWTLRAKGRTTRTFGDQIKAQQAFLELAAELTPGNAKDAAPK